jgi:hypothetical protein
MLVFAGSAGDGPALADSYAMPTAIVGVPVRSPDEYANVRVAIKDFAKEYGLYFYDMKREGPSFTERCRARPLECPDMYLPPHPEWLEGFSLTIHVFSSRCVLVGLSEYSGTWTRRSLNAFLALHNHLRDVTSGRALVLVHPKNSQNESEQRRPYAEPDPERPNQLEDLCARMGVPST